MPTVINKILKYFKPIVRAYNDAGERIESMRFSVPALRVGVLEYGAGQLQTGNSALEGKPVKLYYPPEAVSNDKFLKSLETAPVVVGGHESTTNENNKKIDGWAHTVNYDAALKAAMISGVVKGAKEVAYIKGNLGASGFGASAFVDIYNLRVENGVTPDGQEYDAVAGELRATHVALAPHVRDPENKIKVINAVCINTDGVVEAENVASDDKLAALTEKRLKLEKTFEKMKFDTSVGSDNSEYYKIKKEIQAVKDEMTTLAKNSQEVENAGRGNKTLVIDGTETDVIEFATKAAADAYIAKHGGKIVYYRAHEYYVAMNTNSRGEITNIKEYSMEPKELAALVKNAVDEAIAAKNGEDRMDAMEETLKKHGDTLNEIGEKFAPKKEEEPKAEGENAEGEEEKKDEKEGATLENAKPSQEMVKAFSTALNVDFGAKTPSFATLANLAGIKETDPAARIAAVNTKFGEILQNAPKEKDTAAAHNTAGEVF